MSVIGSNGSGKSSLIEAVSYALWGKTLRDANPWRAGVAGSVTIKIDGVIVTRSISKTGVKKLTWRLEDEAEVKSFGTNTKAQEALEQVIGTWEMWRRTHVLSSQDVSGFSSATNAEKCRLLEAMLGIARFDRARDAAATELSKEARSGQLHAVAVARAEAKVHELSALVANNKRSLSELQEHLQEEPIPEVITMAEVNLSELSQLEAERNQRVSQTAHLLSIANSELLRASSGSCSQCGTAFNHSEADLVRLGEAVLEAKHAKTQAEIEFHEAVSLRNEQRRTLDQLYRLRAEAQASQGTAHLRQRLQKAIQDDTEFLIDSQDELAVCKASLQKSLEIQEAGRLAVKSLSVGGARSHILSKAIEHVEVSANAWMARLSPNLSISVSPYTEGASGATRNEISIGVQGAGGEDGYTGCSGGERRLIDTVLMLALGEAAAAAHGSSVGTLWLDEVGDSLDSQKFVAFEALLRELCLSRTCVFISHTHQVTGSVDLRVSKTAKGTELKLV